MAHTAPNPYAQSSNPTQPAAGTNSYGHLHRQPDPSSAGGGSDRAGSRAFGALAFGASSWTAADLQSLHVQPLPAVPTTSAFTGELPPGLTFRNVCSRCGRQRAVHGGDGLRRLGGVGFGKKCTFSSCGRCGASSSAHKRKGVSMGVPCTLTVEDGAKPGAISLYEAMIAKLVARVPPERVEAEAKKRDEARRAQEEVEARRQNKKAERMKEMEEKEARRRVKARKRDNANSDQIKVRQKWRIREEVEAAQLRNKKEAAQRRNKKEARPLFLDKKEETQYRFEAAMDDKAVKLATGLCEQGTMLFLADGLGEAINFFTNVARNDPFDSWFLGGNQSRLAKECVKKLDDLGFDWITRKVTDEWRQLRYHEANCMRAQMDNARNLAMKMREEMSEPHSACGKKFWRSYARERLQQEPKMGNCISHKANPVGKTKKQTEDFMTDFLKCCGEKNAAECARELMSEAEVILKQEAEEKKH